MKPKPSYQELEKELEILKNNNNSKLFLDLSGIMFLGIDTKGIVTLVNKKTCEIFGYKESEMLGKNWFDNYIPDQYKNEIINLSKKLLSGKINENEYNENPILTKNGEERIIHWHNVPDRDKNGNIIGFLCSGEDITERKKAEKTLKESEEKFRALLKNMSDFIFLIDPELRVITLNRAACELIGDKEENIIGKQVSDLFPAHISEIFEKRLRYVFETSESKTIDSILEIRDLKLFINTGLNPILDKSGKVSAVIGVSRDISENKSAKEALQKSEKKYKNIIDNLTDIYYRADAEGKIIMVSPSAIKTFGYSSMDEIIGNSLEILYQNPNERAKFVTLLKKTGKVKNYRTVLYKKDRSELYVETTANILLDSNGNYIGVEGIVRDITDRKKAEQTLKENEQKMRKLNAEKDKFFSIIAHDLKNPLNLMLGFSDLLIRNFDKYNNKEKKEYINIIQQSVQNTYKLLENLLLWSRAQRGTIDFYPENRNLYLLSANTIELLIQSSESKSITLSNQIPKDLYIEADENMFLTILRNLISNAIKFTPKGGKITIKAHSVTDKNKHSFAEISVKDNGIGIAKETLAQLFTISENVSTKGTEDEVGTGLGLMLCKEFVEKHGGKIRVESEVGKGSKFIFSFPLSVNN
ncbi:MAG: PAS domain-containing sensor histidine kinase [Bacteroidales bacterium]|nr:PAS domain-containing sensor histidine kinase [Bacteroidales bacterium]